MEEFMSDYTLDDVLHPKSIAVVGTNTHGRFVTPLINLEFKGNIYPVNPKYTEISNLKTYPSIKDIPGTVDYVISAVPAPQVPTILNDCRGKNVKGIHLYTARFSETGRKDAIELEKQVLSLAKEMGIRIIGPNCMGVYYPDHGIAWQDHFPKESGTLALSSQSGQAAGQIISSVTDRGIFFNKAVSYGNAIDFNESDFLEYYVQDPKISLILMYIEGPKDGKRFFETLRRATRIKPVVILKGGRGESGTRAVASHTASLAGARELWNTMIKQSGAVPVGSIEELVDVAVTFHFLPRINGRRVGVLAGAGGATVLAADQCEEYGLDVIDLPQDIREDLKNRGVRIWDWIGNPADFSINMGGDDFSPQLLLSMMAKHPDFDLIIANIGGGPGMGPRPGRMGRRRPNGHPPVNGKNNQQKPSNGPPNGPPWMRAMMTPESMLEQYKEIYQHKPFLGLIPEMSPSAMDEEGDGEELLERWNFSRKVIAKMVELKIPHYPSISRAANAVSKTIDYYERNKE